MNETVNISKTMVIHGSVSTTDDLAIEGTVIGDITYEKDLALCGTVEGDITSKGDAESMFELREGAVVLGDIHGKNVSAAGAAKGTLSAKNHLDIKQSAIILGDIHAATMQIDIGSAIEGQLKINPENVDVEKVFDI